MSAPDAAVLSASQPERTRPPAWLRALLRCPVTGEELVDGLSRTGAPVLVSQGARLAYPVRAGVPVLLPHEAQQL